MPLEVAVSLWVAGWFSGAFRRPGDPFTLYGDPARVLVYRQGVTAGALSRLRRP